MKSGYRVFDTHTHLGTARHSGRSCTADELLRNMDRQGVDRALAIPFPVVDDFRSQHDLIGRAVLAHPDRLSGAACLFPLIEQSVFQDEVRRCREQYGFVALKLQPQYHGLNPMSASSDFFFETAIENHMAAVCHTGAGLPLASPALLMMPARKFPDLRIVAAHAGGGIFVHEAIVAALFCPNLWLELSTLTPHHVLEVLSHVESARLMIGSDLPESVDAEMGKILTLDIPDEDKRNILYETGCRVFGTGC
ncbi:MAG TPA: amidohydrolase family protein [Bryobacteraceae bacterium]|nr:amidohydrolase family protein [Bryobacteraceae bacterium]